MKDKIAQLISQALAELPALKTLSDFDTPTPEVERARDPAHGDFASNIAMRLAKSVGKNPRELATDIIALLPADPAIISAQIAGPGFINFFVSDDVALQPVRDVHAQGDQYGQIKRERAPSILVEYVSANPTGPLHVGHGRHAAYGASLSTLLRTAGYSVHEEYYVNDAGRQMEILAVSMWLRALEEFSPDLPFPAAGYRGEYIREISSAWLAQTNAADLPAPEAIFDGLPADGPEEKETYIDALVARAESLLGERFDEMRSFTMNAILDDIRDDLAEFGVTPQRFFSEQSLSDEGTIDAALALLETRGMLYKKGGATWFRATDFGDEKDRVVVRDNGKKTYFASDIAYHFNKRERGFDILLDVLGSDHHGYVARVRAGIEAMGHPGDCLEVRLMQFVTLYRGGKKAQMGTRSGDFVSLRELREEVGNDAARFFYIMRGNDQHLDFDLELATSKSNENPVYYIQYAHARVASVLRQLEEKHIIWDKDNGLAKLNLLSEAAESNLITSISRYVETIDNAAQKRAPHMLVNYLRDLATDFHSYYNAHVFLVDDADLRDARISLITAAQQVLRNGLAILGVSAPQRM